MTNLYEMVRQIQTAASGRGAPASLVCVFTVTILAVTATLCMRHPDPVIQKSAMALFFLVGGGVSCSMLVFLWAKPEVFRPNTSTGRSTSSRQPRKGTIPGATRAEEEANQL